METVSTSKSEASATVSTDTSSAAEDALYEQSKALEKKMRAAKKKIKSCQEIAAKKQEGRELNTDQEEKLGKLLGFKSEVADLEAQLAQLSVSAAK